MTELANFKPLRRTPLCDPRKPLFLLFSAYPEPWNGKGDVEALRNAQVEAYLVGMDGLPEWAIREAVTDFIQGRIDRQNRSKLPTAEQVSAQSRHHVEREASRQSGIRERIADLKEAREWQEHQDWLKTDEGKAHLEHRRKQAAAILSGAKLQSME